MEQSDKRALFRLKSFAFFTIKTIVHSYVDDLACTYKHKSSWVKRMVFQDSGKKETGPGYERFFLRAIIFLVSFWLS